MRAINIKQLFGILFLALSLGITSCDKDDDDNNPPGGGDGDFLTASVGGADFTALTDPATIIGATLDSGIFAVQGGDQDGNTITIRILNYNGTGTYTFGGAGSNGGAIMYLEIDPTVASWGASSIVGTGTVEVTSDSGGVYEGTFNFDGFNAADQTTKSVTNGKFKATQS